MSRIIIAIIWSQRQLQKGQIDKNKTYSSFLKVFLQKFSAWKMSKDASFSTNFCKMYGYCRHVLTPNATLMRNKVQIVFPSLSKTFGRHFKSTFYLWNKFYFIA